MAFKKSGILWSIDDARERGWLVLLDAIVALTDEGEEGWGCRPQTDAPEASDELVHGAERAGAVGRGVKVVEIKRSSGFQRNYWEQDNTKFEAQF